MTEERLTRSPAVESAISDIPPGSGAASGSTIGPIVRRLWYAVPGRSRKDVGGPPGACGAPQPGQRSQRGPTVDGDLLHLLIDMPDDVVDFLYVFGSASETLVLRPSRHPRGRAQHLPESVHGIHDRIRLPQRAGRVFRGPLFLR